MVVAMAFGMMAGSCLIPQQALADEGSGLQGARFTQQAEGTTDVTLSVKYGQTEARSMLETINKFRKSSKAWYWNEGDTKKVKCKNLQPLTYDYELERVAMERAAELAISFSHTRLDGTSKAWDSLSGYSYVGENIAAGQRTASAAFTSWQETDEKYAGQGHRRNMLSADFTAVGIGHAEYNGCHYWVQVFCAPVLDFVETPAEDSYCDVSLSVSDSIITKQSASAAPASITLHPGESAKLPTLSTSLGTAETWPSAQTPVSVAYSWVSSDQGVASIQDGEVRADKVGSAMLSAQVKLRSSVTVQVPVNVVPYDISSASTTSPIGSYTYQGGQAITPVVELAFGSKTLTKDTDYTVAYANNVNVGMGTITYTGIGAFAGTKTISFRIEPASISATQVSTIAAMAYTGKALIPVPVVEFGGLALKEGVDFTVAYANNVNAGTATVTITGKGNFTSSRNVSFKISQAKNSAKAAKTKVSKSFKANKKTKKLAKAQKVALPKVTTKFGTAKWSVATKDKKKVLSLKSGKVLVKKGAKKGSYTIKLKAKVAKTANYKAATTKTVTVKVRVK